MSDSTDGLDTPSALAGEEAATQECANPSRRSVLKGAAALAGVAGAQKRIKEFENILTIFT